MRNPELKPWEKTRNLLISRLRAPVEKVFGTLKRSYRYKRVRYEGLARNETEMLFKLMAYNLPACGRSASATAACVRLSADRASACAAASETGLRRRKDASGGRFHTLLKPSDALKCP